MSHRTQLTLILLIAVAAFGQLASASSYWMYYDCTPSRQTAVTIMNASEWEAENGTILRLYDANGVLVAESSYTIAPYQSIAVFLNEFVTASDESAWGLVEVESELLLQTSAWLGWDESWLSVHNYSAFGRFDPLNVVSYWYGANYANTPNRRTVFTIINPDEEPAAGQFFLYDANGGLQIYQEIEFPSRIPVYLDLDTVLTPATDLWGLVDIQCGKPLLLVCDFYDEDGYLIDFTVVDQPYYMETLTSEESEDS